VTESQREGALTRQERRERRLEKKKEKMPQHGRGLAQVYKHAVEKRAGQPSADGEERKRAGRRKS
jgi:hypothetical protein